MTPDEEQRLRIVYNKIKSAFQTYKKQLRKKDLLIKSLQDEIGNLEAQACLDAEHL